MWPRPTGAGRGDRRRSEEDGHGGRTGAETTWSARWLDALAAAGWGARLKRGAAFTREGLAGGLRVRAGQTEAAVQDPAHGDYRPRLAVRPLGAGEWDAIFAALLADPAAWAALDAGAFPAGIEDTLAGAGLSLLPGPDDLAADCACGERAPCRHVAALCYLLAEALDADPWRLPALRGRDRAALLVALAAARAALVPEAADTPESAARAPAAEAAAAPLAHDGATAAAEAEPGPVAPDATLAAAPPAPPPDFWTPGPGLAAVHADLRAPPQPAPLLRQLGPPPFWTPAAAFAQHLDPVYQAVTDAVLRLALGEGEADETRLNWRSQV